MRSLTITVSDEMAREIDARVATGEYASESEVVRDGLAALLTGDVGLEEWLRGEVVASCREMAADPSRGIPAEDVLSRIEGRVVGTSRR